MKVWNRAKSTGELYADFIIVDHQLGWYTPVFETIAWLQKQLQPQVQLSTWAIKTVPGNYINYQNNIKGYILHFF